MSDHDSTVVEEPGEAGSTVVEEPGEAGRLETTTTPLFLIQGGASDEEVAALTAVLSAIASSGGEVAKAPRSEWASNERKVRPTYHHGPGGWRASALPR